MVSQKLKKKIEHVKDKLTIFVSTSFFQETVVPKIFQVFLGLLIMYLSHLFGRYLVRVIERKAVDSKKKLKDDKQIRVGHRIAANISYYTTLVVGILIILKLFGIETASLIAVLGASSVAIGLALQGTLQDLTSGILMAFHRTINMGEVLQFGEITGRVVDFNMLNTTLEDVRTKALVQIPNRRFQDTFVVNLTRQVGNISMNVAIANTKDNPPIEKTIKILQEAIQKHPSTLGKASIEVGDLSMGSTIVNLKIPAKYYPDLQGEYGTYIRKALDKEKIRLHSRNIREYFTPK